MREQQVFKRAFEQFFERGPQASLHGFDVVAITSNIGHPTSNIEHRTSNIEH
jgi:hypothetical protein